MKRYEPGPLFESFSESPIPIKSGAMQRPKCSRWGITLRHRYDEVGFPCNRTIGSPCPASTYAISRPSTCFRCFLYREVAAIMCVSPSCLNDGRLVGGLCHTDARATALFLRFKFLLNYI